MTLMIVGAVWLLGAVCYFWRACLVNKKAKEECKDTPSEVLVACMLWPLLAAIICALWPFERLAELYRRLTDYKD